MATRTINNGGEAGHHFGLKKSSLHHFLPRAETPPTHTNSFLTVVMRWCLTQSLQSKVQ